MSDHHNKILVDPDWLEARLGSNVLILDCWRQAAYDRVHIKGALCLPIDYWLKEKDELGVARGMRLIDRGDFETILGSLGIARDTPVVTYDENQGRAAARVWWVLKYHGHEDVRVLNGGWSRWFLEGRPVSRDVLKRTPQCYKSHIRPSMKIDVDELLRNGDKYQVVDARSHAEWIGTDSHGNPRTGRIPGAVHLDWSSLVSPGPAESFREETELAAIVAAANLDRKAPTVTYCQAGVRGSYLAFVLTLLGFEDVRVFDGSIREWASRSDTPMSAGS